MFPYPKLHHLGTRETANLFEGEEIEVQEKIDGSQFRFWVEEDTGHLRCCSRGGEIDVLNPQKLFGPTVEHLRFKCPIIPDGIVFYGEAMCAPHHNKLAYERAPEGNLVLFDALVPRASAPSGYHHMQYEELEHWARVMQVQPANQLAFGNILPTDLDSFLEGPSMLGGMREGVVIKNRRNGVMGKYVNPRFREIMGVKPRANKYGEWPAFLAALSESVSTEARWEKAVQRLREEERLADSPKDIGAIVRLVQADIVEECQAYLADELMKKALPEITKQAARPIALWYKERLARSIAE